MSAPNGATDQDTWAELKPWTARQPGRYNEWLRHFDALSNALCASSFRHRPALLAFRDVPLHRSFLTR